MAFIHLRFPGLIFEIVIDGTEGEEGRSNYQGEKPWKPRCQEMPY